MKKLFVPLIFFAFFFSVFIIEWYTPIHSDDYTFSMLGISFARHLDQYMSWSGRVVADYTSSLLLATKSRFTISTLTGLLAIAFCYFITKIPTGTMRWGKHDTTVFILVFLTFWIANPNIGQVVFWVVGSANYLWTNFFVVVWLWNLNRIHKLHDDRTQLWMVLVGILAGCSNESIAPFVVFISILAITHDIYRQKRVPFNKIIYSFSAAIGVVILLCSPGNLARANVYSQYYKLSYLQQLTNHITDRMSGHLALIWISYVILALLGFILWYLYKKGYKFNQYNLNITILSLLLGVGTSVIMFAAPLYPDRVVMSTFVFILIAISFLSRELLQAGDGYVCKSILLINGILLGVFIWSFSLMYISYTHTYQQNQIRLGIIHSQIEKHKKSFYIPDFYFQKMQNSGGEFDFWHIPKVYGKYFGVEYIQRKKTDFDYAFMASAKEINIDKENKALFDNKGNFIIIGPHALKGEVKLSVGGIEHIIKDDDFVTVEMNEEHWSYKQISSGIVTNVSTQ